MRTRKLSGRRNLGFTMLEVLVTLAIVTIWLLATANVQSSSSKLNKAAHFRSEAVFLASEIAERMEANSRAAVTGSYACTGCEANTTSTACVNASCSDAGLATFDLNEWGARVAATLPGATATIEWACTAGCTPTVPPSSSYGSYTITVGWTDRADRSYKPVSDSSATTESQQYVATKVVFYDPGK